MPDVRNRFASVRTSTTTRWNPYTGFGPAKARSRRGLRQTIALLCRRPVGFVAAAGVAPLFLGNIQQPVILKVGSARSRLGSDEY